MAHQSISLQRFTERRAAVFNIEAIAASGVLHTYYLVNTLQYTYVSQNPDYIKRKITPYVEGLQNDIVALTEAEANAPTEKIRDIINETRAEMNNVLTITDGILSQAEIGNWPSATVRLGTLRQQETELLSTLDSLLQTVHNYQQSEGQFLQQHAPLAVFLPIVMTLLGLLLLIGGMVTTRQFVLHPIQQLEKQVQQFAEGDFSIRVSIARRDEIGRLAHTFNMMADRIQESYVTMAERIEERTSALQKRTAQLQAATEIGRAVATLSEMNEMLARAALLISQRYGFYHVGIFLSNPASDEVSLQAAYTRDGNAAERLLQSGLRSGA